MTVTEPTTPVCPSCGSTETMILSDGNGRCFECMSEWDPKNLAGIPRPPAPVAVDPPEVAGLEEIIATADAETDTLEADLIGASVVLEGGQMATIRSFPDRDHAVVMLSDLSEVTIPVGDIERSIQEHDTHAPEAPAEPDPASVVAIEYVYMLSDLMIRMGIASIVDGDDGPEAGPPVLGWLTRDEELHQLVEAAVATTVARLITSYDIPVDDLLEGLNAQSETPDTGDPQEATE